MYPNANRLINEVMARKLHEEGGFKYNVATTSLEKARAYCQEVLDKTGDRLEDVIPDFDQFYVALQKQVKAAPDIPRIEMPVIEPTDMDDFHSRLQTGHLDIFQPYAKGKLHAPKDLKKGDPEAEEYITLGIKDGEKEDDTIPAKWTQLAVNRLKPTQSEIWLEKLIAAIAKFGIPAQGSPVTQQTIIVSKEGYILDGHHRYGQAMLADPTLKLKALHVPLDIETLLKIGRSYGNAIGNQQKG